jgi:ferritin-like metal-binding protein YciE
MTVENHPRIADFGAPHREVWRPQRGLRRADATCTEIPVKRSAACGLRLDMHEVNSRGRARQKQADAELIRIAGAVNASALQPKRLMGGRTEELTHMHLETLQDLYVRQVAELYRVEDQSVEVTQTLQAAAHLPALASAIGSHARSAREHLQALQRVLGEVPPRHADLRIMGTSGLLMDCLAAAREADGAPDVRDAELISLLQRVLHAQIADYGCTRSWAWLFDDREAVGILQRCLCDEKDCDARLTQIAEQVNRRAAGPACRCAPTALTTSREEVPHDCRQTRSENPEGRFGPVETQCVC